MSDSARVPSFRRAARQLQVLLSERRERSSLAARSSSERRVRPGRGTEPCDTRPWLGRGPERARGRQRDRARSTRCGGVQTHRSEQASGRGRRARRGAKRKGRHGCVVSVVKVVWRSSSRSSIVAASSSPPTPATNGTARPCRRGRPLPRPSLGIALAPLEAMRRCGAASTTPRP